MTNVIVKRSNFGDLSTVGEKTGEKKVEDLEWKEELIFLELNQSGKLHKL